MTKLKSALTAFSFAVLFLFPLSLTISEATLQPEEIVVIMNDQLPESLRIGTLFSTLRKVPPHHLLSVSVTMQEVISRDEYDKQLARPVRTFINTLFDSGIKIKCLVTTYGIPLRIKAFTPLITTDDLEEIVRSRNLKQKERNLLREMKKKGKDVSAETGRKIKKLDAEITRLNLRINQLNGSDTVAAVDSELALVLAPDYDLSGYLPNPRSIHFNPQNAEYAGPVLMVSRLDAPTPELAESLIRTSVQVEKSGLSGVVYLDARGKTGNNPYGRYDQDIRKTAHILRKSSMPVILDNRPQVFQNGEAPDAALYCGWYSLGRYVDAFEWSTGAVGYHVASAEAVSIHASKSTYWVKSMIEKGVIATLGPVAEPYLNAFPRPSLFFPLLMSGSHTLVEVFTMTNPFLSWRIVLIGDPLYNPFRNKPAFELKYLLPYL